MKDFLRRWWAFLMLPVDFAAGAFLPLWAVFLVGVAVGVWMVVALIRLRRDINRSSRRLKALQAAHEAGAPMEVMERIASDPQYGKPLRAYRDAQVYDFKHRDERQ